MRTFIRSAERVPRLRLTVAAGVLAGLAAAAVAAAHFGGASAASTVSATFYANTASGTATSQTCTTPTTSNAITVTDATFTGTSTSTLDPSLNGPLTIKVRSVYDSTTNLGWVSADYVVNNSTASTPTWFSGALSAVDNNGTLQGLLTGSQSGGSRVVANVTSAFSASGGFALSTAQGAIGGGGSASDSGIMTSNPCSSMDDQGGQHGPPHFDMGQGNGKGSFDPFSKHGHQGNQDD